MTAGTAACVADLFTFPLDTAKVRLQVGERAEIQNRDPALPQRIKNEMVILTFSVVGFFDR